jgi:hypothetical protein
MKEFIKGATVTLALVAALVATSAQAGFFSSWATGDWPTQESNAYKVEAYGFDFRVYEWRSTENPNVVCTASFTDEGAIGMQCFDSPADVSVE